MQSHEGIGALPILAIGGATAVGKSAVGIALAELLRDRGIEAALIS